MTASRREQILRVASAWFYHIFMCFHLLILLLQYMIRQYISLLLGSSTCIQQSANDGYFRNKDCWQLNNFVCEINANAEFSEPPEGKLWFVFIHAK